MTKDNIKKIINCLSGKTLSIFDNNLFRRGMLNLKSTAIMSVFLFSKVSYVLFKIY